MKDILLKYKKIFCISLPLFLIILVVYLAIYRLETLVSIGFSLFTKGGLRAEKVFFEKGSNKTKGKIVLKNAKLYGENKYLIAEIPTADILYDNWKINNINIYNPDVNFVRDDSSYNIVDIFIGGKAKANKPKPSKPKEEKVSTSKPILENINVYDGNLVYYDETYTEQIVKKLDKVNGYVKFLEGYRTDLEFSGIGAEDNKENIFIKFDNSKNKNEFTIKAKDVKFDDKLFQYAYDSKSTIKDVTGDVNISLKISKDGFFGDGTLRNGSARYLDLDMPIKNVNLNVNFSGQNIDIRGKYKLGDYPGKFTLDYSKENGVKVGFYQKNVLYSDAEKYKYLKTLNLGFANMKLEKANVELFYKDKLRAEVDFASQNGDRLGEFYFKDILGKFVYEDDTFYLQDVYSKIFVKNKATEREIIGNLKLKDGKGETELDILGNEKNLFSDFKINFDFEILKEKFLFDVKSRILDINGDYTFDTKELVLKQGNSFYSKYNFDKKYVEEIKGTILTYINGYEFKTILEPKERVLFVKSTIGENNKKSQGEVKAELYLDTFDYWIDFDLKNIKLADEKGTIAGNYKGKIESLAKVFQGQCFVEKGTIYERKNNIALRRIYGVVDINNKNPNRVMDISFDGEIGKLTTNTERIKGIKTAVRYHNHRLEVLDFSNRYMSLFGNLNLKTQFLNFNVKFNEITEEVFPIDKLDYEITNAEGKILGSIREGIDRLKGDFFVKDAHINFGEDKKIDFFGEIKYANRELYSKEFLIGKNILDFRYSVKDEKGNYKFKINENEIINVIPKTKLKITGESTGEIVRDRVKGKFDGEIIGLKAGDKYLPKIVLDGNYTNEGVDFKNISFLTRDKRKIVKVNGKIDFRKKYLDFELPNQNIRLKDFEILDDELDGNVALGGKLNGTFDEIKYNFSSSDSKIYYQNRIVGSGTFAVYGDKKNIFIENFDLKNGKNRFKILGNYNIEKNLANIKLESSIEKFENLNDVLYKYGIKNLGGRARINLELVDNIPQGNLLVDNLSGDFPKFNLYLKNINGKMAVDKSKIKIDTLDGSINNGRLKLLGEVRYNNDLDDFMVDSFEKLSYNLTLEGKNIDYLYKDLVKINFSTRLRFNRDRLYGTVNINSGKISNITSKDFGIINTIKEFLKKKELDKGPVIKNLDIPVENSRMKDSDIKVNIRINNENGIKVDIKNIAGYITDVKGEIHSSGILSGSLENLNFLGESSIKEGEFSFNNKKFYVDRAAALFNDKNQTILKANPEIIFITKTNMNSKIYEISLMGPARKLDMYVKSENEVSVSGVNDILFSDGENSDGTNENTVAFITELVGGQISDIVVSPIVDVVKTMFGLSDLRVSSSIITHEKSKKNEEEESTMSFGAYVEAENPIYKDKLFWKARFNFVDTTDVTNSNLSMKNWIEYDLGIYQKINKNLSFGGGVQKLRKDIDMFEKDKNHYIEFKFEKKFDF